MVRYLYLFTLVFYTLNSYSQETATFNGYVRDASNGEELIGATVYINSISQGTQTNVYGYYSLTVPVNTYEVKISYLGYQTLVKKINLTENLNLDFELVDETEKLEEVVVVTKREDENVKSIDMSVNKVDMRTFKKMPALLGEVDLIKSIQLLPGVSSVGEGAPGFNVRGGGVDQNLILLDEAPVFNSSHLFGFFSIFNPDAVKDVKLIKGGIPANYGGRSSSILDVRMKEGNSKKPEFSGGIGTIFSRFAFESPFAKKQGSFIVAFRRSYIDVLAKPFLKSDLKKSRFNFYDLTAKANYKLNEKNNVFLSGYFGKDVFGDSFGFDWGNATTSFRWNHVFNERLFLNTTLYYSNYNYALDSDLKKENDQDSFKWNSKIINYSIKPDFNFYINPKNTLSFGGQIIFYTFNPGTAIARSGGDEVNISLDNRYSTEGALYISNENKISNKVTLAYGLRYSFYNFLGPTTKLFLDQKNSAPGETRIITNLEKISKGESAQRYGNLEPRFSMNIGLGNYSSLKLSYNRLAQYIHLLSNTAAASPLDVWTPSTNNIKPKISDQIAFGYFQNFSENVFEASVELYYKWMQNQIDYVRNADLLLNPYFEAELLFGKGRAYGAEIFIKKTKGKLNGWLSYTLARTEKLVNGINNNEWYPDRIDKTHNISFVGIYDPTERWTFSSNFTFYTGTPATFPTNKYIIQGWALPQNYYDTRNNYRIPNSVRLDLSATYKNRRPLFRKGESEFVMSIYNVFNRRNPFTVYTQPNPDDFTQTQAIKYSVFGSIIPAITFNFKF